MYDRYDDYKRAMGGRAMPFAFVDLDVFDKNVADVARRAAGKPVRIASKSIRCVALMRRILEDAAHYRGVMAYSVREAVHLSQNGFDDILVAYPALSEVAVSGVCDAIKSGKSITLMMDCGEHVRFLDRAGRRARVKIPVCLDIDMASRFPGVYFGVRRSSIVTPDQALALWREVKRCRYVRLDGVMGYEAQIAGLQDRPPHAFFKNRLVSLLKRKSVPEVTARRAAIVDALRADGCRLRFVNGGGTGSIEVTRSDPSVTEVTAGSAFYAPTLFDHYAGFQYEPAAGFAIEIVRRPGPDIYTCQGGGYIASGAAGRDKLPQPWLPSGARLIPQEGAGEVQTPVFYKGPRELSLGDPVFMRHAKAGELCERFNSLLLVSKGGVVDEVPTYRGEGECFL